MDRRNFLQGTVAGSSLAVAGLAAQAQEERDVTESAAPNAVPQNMIGVYGPWAAGIVGDSPARLSFRNRRFTQVDTWRPVAKERVLECLLQPGIAQIADVQTHQQTRFDGVDTERLSWRLPYGPRTEALFLKPAGASGPLPAVLGLHDHGGNKFFGHRKITRTGQEMHPVMRSHQTDYYGGSAWANELAKKGFAVLVHDTFTFGSRRVDLKDLAPPARPRVPDVMSDSPGDVETYNRFAAEHEHLMAKSLFCAGTTWPGVFTVEDQRALDYLAARPEVDADRLGCAGLSGGGLRTVYLAGLDERIKCACCVGMMTTWRDYLLHKAHTHTWMIYIPGLPLDLDYPEILGIRAPLPTLVLNNDDDPLFTPPEMHRADRMLAEVYAKAHAKEAYRCRFFPGSHKFDREMQAEAFEWFDRWLT